ncbi:hypothetical protein ACUN24_08980 [Pedobacter sp. WC2501]|uniref:hypothetical protein n=1 Tax=Pedobacter sp. WC2501 TaxID=3461400 RepID=UPI00404615C4
MMNKTFLLLVITFFLTSCKAQEYETEPFDLSTLSFKLNSEEFYSKSMDRKNNKFTSDRQYVEKDTLNEYDLDWTGNKNKIFGIQYRVVSYSPKDTVAFYKNLTFSRLQTLTTAQGDLMLMSATGKGSDDNIKSFIQELTAEYPNPSIKAEEFSFFKTYHYTWKINDRIIQLVSKNKIDFDQTPHQVITEKEKKDIIEIEKNRRDEIHLYICKSDYEQKLRGKLNSGEFSAFK